MSTLSRGINWSVLQACALTMGASWGPKALLVAWASLRHGGLGLRVGVERDRETDRMNVSRMRPRRKCRPFLT